MKMDPEWVTQFMCARHTDIPEGRHKGAKSLMSPVKGIRKPRARVSTVRWNLKEAGGIIIAERTEIV